MNKVYIAIAIALYASAPFTASALSVVQPGIESDRKGQSGFDKCAVAICTDDNSGDFNSSTNGSNKFNNLDPLVYPIDSSSGPGWAPGSGIPGIWGTEGAPLPPWITVVNTGDCKSNCTDVAEANAKADEAKAKAAEAKAKAAEANAKAAEANAKAVEANAKAAEAIAKAAEANAKAAEAKPYEVASTNAAAVIAIDNANTANTAAVAANAAAAAANAAAAAANATAAAANAAVSDAIAAVSDAKARAFKSSAASGLLR
ncbi:hypothetical protein [Vibrio gallaecicus]|uniref:Uncharacterized protein n=1 Tax=Vibrio gallaecicus TaxID=552386 RepID=A0ABV4N822_9VIBR